MTIGGSGASGLQEAFRGVFVGVGDRMRSPDPVRVGSMGGKGDQMTEPTGEVVSEGAKRQIESMLGEPRSGRECLPRVGSSDQALCYG